MNDLAEAMKALDCHQKTDGRALLDLAIQGSLKERMAKAARVCLQCGTERLQ